VAEDTTNLEVNEAQVEEVVEETTVLGSAVEETEAAEEVAEVVEGPASKAPEKYELALEGVELDADTLAA